MEYLSPAALQDQQQMILCCQCGTLIEPNPANMCVGCLRTRVDITEGIHKQGTVYFCKFCERYLQPPAYWLSCGRDSQELLSLCVSKLHGMNKVRLVNAEFVWTEPHSKRLKLKLTVQKEVINSAILEQTFLVEFVVFNQMCTDCQRKETNDFWKAVVQVRQKASHKKTFFYLEQLILKSTLHSNVIKVKEFRNGIDFYFATKQDARKLVDFIVGVVPCRYKTSQELISHDTHTNVYNYKHTFSVEIVPVCKDNIVCLPKKLAQSLGSISPIGICTRVTTSLQITDPATLQAVDISANSFWRTPFSALCQFHHMTKFLVLQCEPLETPPSYLHINGKFHLADVWVLPITASGCGDQQIHCRSHLGHLLHAGDEVLGFYLARANLNNEHIESLRSSDIPDVVLVKKCYGDRKRRQKKRNWHLQQLDKELVEEVDSEEYERDMTAFMEDLEEDKSYRQNINIFLDSGFVCTSEDGGTQDDDDELPSIPVEEMLQQLTLQDQTKAAS